MSAPNSHREQATKGEVAIACVIFYIFYWPRMAPRLWWQRIRLWRLMRQNMKLRAQQADLQAQLEALQGRLK